MADALPIPPEQKFYADAFYNPQSKPIASLIDFVHYPTLGCPALLGPEHHLQALMSLPVDVDCGGVGFRLVGRHEQPGGAFELQRQGAPEAVADGAGGARKLFRYRLRMDAAPFGLFDLRATIGSREETQYNAVRRYRTITGSEQVVFCGDSQYHVDNQICLERFIQRVNELDVAWVAIIGDICDNGVKGWKNILKLAAGAQSGPVTHYYGNEYQRSHELLRNLRHPVVVVPGNHDGMSAYCNYDEGKPSGVFTGPDTLNTPEYDGLHHFRRTFGPLYFGFDWSGTRYLCNNTFELTRNQRLGYHAIVANWGGWMRPGQLEWVRGELKTAKDQRKVMLMHHDPRGGSEGMDLGHYHRIRPYRFDRRWPILKAYLSYALRHGRTTWQQEWMAPEQGDLADHPVKGLLQAMLQSEVWAVIMGHDNENWVDSYFGGQDLFKTEASTIRFARRAQVQDNRLVDDIVDHLESADYEALANLLDARDETIARAALSAALGELERQARPAEILFAENAAKQWGLDVKSAIHFVHVNDVGSYAYSRQSDFDDYGFVVASLDHGAPVQLQSHRISGGIGLSHHLEVD
ncbi:MAG: metallophosphoesterase [Acidobacteriota bacterium]